jgi:Domain of unknown function (DUF4266)
MTTGREKTNSFLAFIVCIAFVFIFSSCKTVKPYQRAYLNDSSMSMQKTTLEKFSQNVHTYREGASGGGRGKTSGGCGCN